VTTRRRARILVYVAVYILSVVLSVSAALAGSVGPEGASGTIGLMLETIYRPYFMFFCEYLEAIGFVVAVLLSGVPAVGVVWLLFRARLLNSRSVSWHA